MKQLKMIWFMQPIADLKLPSGFRLRTYQDGDGMGWIEACKDGLLGTEGMKEEDFRRMMLDEAGIYPEGIFFIVNEEDEILGTATGVLKPEPKLGYLHMVSIKPEYRGKGLSKFLNASVLKYLVERGCAKVTLNTDDFRIPAIRTYLYLGFRPVLHDDDMLPRWQEILPKTGYCELDTFSQDESSGPVIKICP